jgi:hypothetical protein
MFAKFYLLLSISLIGCILCLSAPLQIQSLKDELKNTNNNAVENNNKEFVYSYEVENLETDYDTIYETLGVNKNDTYIQLIDFVETKYVDIGFPINLPSKTIKDGVLLTKV